MITLASALRVLALLLVIGFSSGSYAMPVHYFMTGSVNYMNPELESHFSYNDKFFASLSYDTENPDSTYRYRTYFAGSLAFDGGPFFYNALIEGSDMWLTQDIDQQFKYSTTRNGREFNQEGPLIRLYDDDNEATSYFDQTGLLLDFEDYERTNWRIQMVDTEFWVFDPIHRPDGPSDWVAGEVSGEIDNIWVVKVSEPSTLSLLILGLVALSRKRIRSLGEKRV